MGKHSKLLLYFILASAFLVRVINLNYNSAFNDEAIYIVVGRMGLFVSDWWSYGANLWMAGLPYIYPTLTALAYQLGGLMGSRLLNVVLGTILVEEVYRLTKIINLYDKKTNQLAALIAAFVASFSAVGLYVSRLATYDMPSFLLMIIGINSYLKAKNYPNGRYYFIASICLLAAFLTKIVVVFFFPLLFLISLFVFYKSPPLHKKLTIIYLYAPFFIGIALYTFFNLRNLNTFISTHKSQGLTKDAADILSLIWQVSEFLIIIAIPSVLTILKSQKIKELTTLAALASIIPAFHIALMRLATLDKHMYLSIIFLSIIVGYGISLILKTNKGLFRYIISASLLAWGSLYSIASYQFLYQMEHSWNNSSEIEKFLLQKVKLGDRILTENGGSVVLALYDKIFPPGNIVTFDWIDYSGLTGNNGYLQAVNDSYFDYIELEADTDEERGSLKSDIKQNMTGNYTLSLKLGDSEIYERSNK
jgi:4-amino-4-deoxy-L-arabinose transferase-like glycosyltransferase